MADGGFADEFFALAADDGEGNAALPNQIPANIPTNYDIPEDRAGVLNNLRLKNGYRLMGVNINIILEHMRSEPNAKDKESHRKQIQKTVDVLKRMKAVALRLLQAIEEAHQLPFNMPEDIQNRLTYILPADPDPNE